VTEEGRSIQRMSHRIDRKQGESDSFGQKYANDWLHRTLEHMFFNIFFTRVEKKLEYLRRT